MVLQVHDLVDSNEKAGEEHGEGKVLHQPREGRDQGLVLEKHQESDQQAGGRDEEEVGIKPG